MEKPLNIHQTAQLQHVKSGFISFLEMVWEFFNSTFLIHPVWVVTMPHWEVTQEHHEPSKIPTKFGEPPNWRHRKRHFSSSTWSQGGAAQKEQRSHKAQPAAHAEFPAKLRWNPRKSSRSLVWDLKGWGEAKKSVPTAPPEFAALIKAPQPLQEEPLIGENPLWKEVPRKQEWSFPCWLNFGSVTQEPCSNPALQGSSTWHRWKHQRHLQMARTGESG